jgi:hypothetical protein
MGIRSSESNRDGRAAQICHVARSGLAPNFTLKLVRPGFGPAAELPTPSSA